MTASNNTRNIEHGQSRKAKLTHGFGFNSGGKYKTKMGGRHTTAYRTWRNILYRCYDKKAHRKTPTYIGCAVSIEWHDFQNFADWFEAGAFSGLGYHVDKDILVSGNKVYSPDTCCLVPSELNLLFTNHGAKRGDSPQGVSFNKWSGKYSAQISINSKMKCIGFFNCPDEAYQAYKTTKEAYVKEKALEWQDRIADNVFQALMNWTLDS